MGRSAITRMLVWAANAALGVLCCWLIAQIALSLLDATLLVAPDELAAPAATASATPGPTRLGTNREIVLQRNLFNVSTVVGTPTPVVEEEDLEATKLPVRLLGTAASGDPKRSWAAVEDLETRRHLVVRVHDPLKATAKVLRIERRRIVLENAGRREELALGDELSAGAGAAARPQAARPAPTPVPAVAAANVPALDPNLAARVRRLAEDRFAVNRNDVVQAARNPAQLFQQARILPRYENGAMVGVQLNAIKPGSLFEQIGIQSGDTITTMNGVRMDSPENSAGLIRELTEARSFNVVVQGSDGRERTLNYELQE